MLTNTISEIRTYGEGFIIVDQSPLSVDVVAIKNTNTKIVLRTPEAHDREAIGRSIGLTDDQVEEIAKLPSGVAVIYQNNWINPVLTMINKADIKEIPYVHLNPEVIKPVKEARTKILFMLLQPWIPRERMSRKMLNSYLQSLDIRNKDKSILRNYIDNYLFCSGTQIWRIENIPELQSLTRAILGITQFEFEKAVSSGISEELRMMIRRKTTGLTYSEIDEVCHILTKAVNEEC